MAFLHIDLPSANDPRIGKKIALFEYLKTRFWVKEVKFSNW